MFVGVLSICTALGQNYKLGSIVGLNLNKKFKNSYQLNFKIDNRILAAKGIWQELSGLDVQYDRTEVSLIGAKKLGLNGKLALGYLLQLKEEEQLHRSIQQYSWVRKYSAFRLAHRMAADQTMSEARDIRWRWRYRIASDWALNGQSVDEKEFYLKVNNEYLYTSNKADEDLEIRLVPVLGYVLDSSKKLEAGLDYRFSDFMSSTAAQHDFWLRLQLYFSL